MGLDSIPQMAREIYVRDNFTCQYCERNGLRSYRNFKMLDIGFVIPQEKMNVMDDFDNCVVICNICNKLKQDFDKAYDFEDSKRDRDYLIQLARKEIDRKRTVEVYVFCEIREEMENLRS